MLAVSQDKTANDCKMILYLNINLKIMQCVTKGEVNVNGTFKSIASKCFISQGERTDTIAQI